MIENSKWKTVNPAVVEHMAMENEKLRELLRRIYNYVPIPDQIRIDAALSQQGEPTDTFTAVDMATAAAQGFRDGQASVEQAPAQDEREAFEAFQSQRPSHWRVTNRAAWEAALKYAAENYRPAQTEQQPVAHRLINAEGEVMTDWHDGAPPDNFIDLCGVAMAGTRVELAFADPIAQTAPQPGKVSAYRTLDRHGNAVTDWIDGDPAGGEPIVPGGSFQLAYSAPQPEQGGLVDAASGALAAIQDALEDAYHNAYPECCGQAHLECCGSPLQAWSEADQKTMERFAPHEKALRAALSAQGASK